MMDIKEIKPEYYKAYEWSMEQEDTQAIVKIQIPEGLTQEDFHFVRDEEKFTANFKDELPFLCGKISEPFSDYKCVFTDDSLEIHFIKSTTVEWNLPILDSIDPSTPMDPRSTFYVGMVMMQDPSQQIANILLAMAAQMFYPPAIILLASIGLQTTGDISNMVPLLEKIVEEYKVGEAATFLGQLARARKYPIEKALVILEKGSALGDPSAETMLGILYSPYEEPHGEWENKEKASEWFLKSFNHPRSRYGLGLIKYFNNEEEEGMNLIEEARNEIEELPPIPEKDPSIKPENAEKKEEEHPANTTNLKKVGIIAGSIASIAGFALLSYAFIKRRK